MYNYVMILHCHSEVVRLTEKFVAASSNYRTAFGQEKKLITERLTRQILLPRMTTTEICVLVVVATSARTPFRLSGGRTRNSCGQRSARPLAQSFLSLSLSLSLFLSSFSLKRAILEKRARVDAAVNRGRHGLVSGQCARGARKDNANPSSL